MITFTPWVISASNCFFWVSVSCAALLYLTVQSLHSALIFASISGRSKVS